jgi:predicted permease
MAMDDQARRVGRITLLDMMILVAATAVGTAVYRAALPEMRDWGARIAGISAILACWSWAALYLRIRRPRRDRRRWVARPGIAACTASALGTVLAGLFWLLQYGRYFALGDYPRDQLELAMIVSAIITGPAVTVSWLMIALSRRWRRETDWIGWLGRILGVGWMILFILMGLLIR